MLLCCTFISCILNYSVLFMHRLNFIPADRELAFTLLFCINVIQGLLCITIFIGQPYQLNLFIFIITRFLIGWPEVWFLRTAEDSNEFSTIVLRYKVDFFRMAEKMLALGGDPVNINNQMSWLDSKYISQCIDTNFI